MRSQRFARVSAALCGLALAVSGCSSDSDSPTADNPGGVIISGDSDSRFHGAELPKPYQMPDETLTDTDDEPFNLVRDTSGTTLVFFGYTHCPDVCPLVMSDLTSAYLRLPDDVRDQTRVVFITTDPARDTPSVLRGYLDGYDDAFIGLTGDLDRIVAAADGMGVAIEGRHKLPSGGYDVGHGVQVIGFSGHSAPVIWTQGTSVEDMVDDVEELTAS